MANLRTAAKVERAGFVFGIVAVILSLLWLGVAAIAPVLIRFLLLVERYAPSGQHILYVLIGLAIYWGITSLCRCKECWLWYKERKPHRQKNLLRWLTRRQGYCDRCMAESSHEFF